MKATQRYRETRLRAASPGQLVCALFDQAIVQAERARIQSNKEEQKKWTVAAIQTLTELEAGLEEQDNPLLFQQLQHTYGLIGDHLVFAVQSGEETPFLESIEALQSLRSEWARIYQLPS